MAHFQPLDSHNMTTLFQTAFLLNFAYAFWGRTIGLPISAYVRLEREIRQRLNQFSEISDEEVLRDTQRLSSASRRSETVLRVLLRIGSVSLYISAFVGFVLMIAVAFGELHMTRQNVVFVLVLLLVPIPLKLGTLWVASRYYLGKIERRVMALARSTGVGDIVAEETAGASVKHKLHVAMDHIEGALGRK